MTTEAPDWAALIPHQGRMRLLDSIVERSAGRICCEAGPRLEHPLARGGQLSAVHAVELAAQAAALHQALGQGVATGPRPGWLVQVRAAAFYIDRLDSLANPLRIEATLLLEGSEIVRYRYAIWSGPTAVSDGELTLMLGSP